MDKIEKERMVFYVDVNDLSQEKAEEYIRKLITKYRLENGIKLETNKTNCCQYCCGKPLC